MEENGDKKEPFWTKLTNKLKGIKHIEVIIAVVLGAIILLIYMSSIGGNDLKQSSTQNSMSISEYSEFLENKLSNVLSKIDGAGNVSTMITFESGTEYVYATNDETKTNTVENSNSTTQSQTSSSVPFLKNNEGLLIKEILPKISGVVVVASGAKNAKVKIDIIQAVQTLLGIPSANIEVLAGK